MSTYTVTSLADNGGSGTLRHEITVASASTGPQTIVFSPSLAGGTVNLASGSLVLNHSSGELTIQGGTGDEVTVDAQNNSRVFTIASGTTAELDNLVITGGNTTANGGGIDNDGTLTLNNDTVTNNFASGEGGGIANENGGTATINDSTISNNHAALGGSLVPTQADGQTSASTYGSYGNSGNNYLAAFDGNANTYFDAPGSDGNWIQLDLGSPIAITQIGYAPRTSLESRMVGGVFEASNDPTFSTGVTTLYTVTSAPADGMTYQTISPSVDCKYVRYVSPAGSYGNIAEMQVFNTTGNAGGQVSPLSGVPSANTTGSYDGIGNNYTMAFDGNTNTYFDAPTSDGNWIQMDLGTPMTISQIVYAPRVTWESRMVGGIFEGSDDSTFTTGVTTLFTVTSAPADGYNSQGINSSGTYRYIRYVSPSGSYGNIAEMQVFVIDGAGSAIFNGVYPNNALTIVNSTISGNIAPGRFGGAIAGGNATINITDATISGNSGGGVAGGSSVTINGTIAANNSGQDVSVPVASVGSYDLIGDGSGGLTGTNNSFGSIASPINPLLGALANNGGVTQTMALLPGSPAIGGGSLFYNASGYAVTADQRGLDLPDGVTPDIGAYDTEAGTTSPGLRIEVLGMNGSQGATATSIGQVIQLEVWAVVTGSNPNGALDTVSSVAGSFISSMASTGSVHGDLSDSLNESNLGFGAYGTQAGTQQDLNGDGNLDIGSDDGSNIADYMNARAGQNVTGIVTPFTDEVYIGNLYYTVTSLPSGGEADINFFPRPVIGPGYAAEWQQDGQPENETTATLAAGTPFRINAGSAPIDPIQPSIEPDVPPPSAPQAIPPAASASTIVALAGSGAFSITYSSGQYSFSGGTTSISPVSASNFGGFTFTGGGASDTLTISGAGGDPTLLNDAGSDGTSLAITVESGTITFNTTEHLSSLAIGAGAAATMSANGRSVLVTNSLSLAGSLNAWTGTLDLRNAAPNNFRIALVRNSTE